MLFNGSVRLRSFTVFGRWGRPRAHADARWMNSNECTLVIIAVLMLGAEAGGSTK